MSFKQQYGKKFNRNLNIDNLTLKNINWTERMSYEDRKVWPGGRRDLPETDSNEYFIWDYSGNTIFAEHTFVKVNQKATGTSLLNVAGDSATMDISGSIRFGMATGEFALEPRIAGSLVFQNKAMLENFMVSMVHHGNHLLEVRQMIKLFGLQMLEITMKSGL